MNTSGDKLEPVVLGNVVALQVVDLVSRSTRTCFRPAALSPRAFSRVLSSAKVSRVISGMMAMIMCGHGQRRKK